MGIKTLGKLQQGTTEPMEFAYYGCRGGLNVLDPPQLVGDEDLTIAKDGYLQATGDGGGGFRMRNGMSFYSTANPPATGMMILARFFQGVQNGSVISPETKLLLGQIGDTLYSITGSAYTSIGSIGSGANPMTWARIQDPNDTHYPSGLTDVIVICTGVGGPYVYDGAHSLYSPAGWSAASGASWCSVVNGILWFGGIPATPNQIFGSGDGITDSMETLPAIRNFVFSCPVTGLCALGAGANASLIVGLNKGIGILFGTGPSTFYLQEMPFEDSVAAGRTMVSANGVVFFLGHNGVYSFDGMSVPKQISVKVQPWIQNDPFVAGYPMANNRNLSWSCVYNNRLHIGYCSSSSVPDTILCYDLDVGGWTVLVPAGGIASMCLLDAPSDPAPYEAIVGSSTTGAALNWDTDTFTTMYDDAPNNTAPVLAQCQSKNFQLGVTGATKALQRFYPELFISDIFLAQFVTSIDSGNQIINSISSSSGSVFGNSMIWDFSLWDESTWGGTGLSRFGPPYSRIDFDGNEGSEFAFGIKMTSALSPWIYSGGTGVYGQRSRT